MRGEGCPTHTRVGIVAFSGSPSRLLEWLFPRAPSALIAQTLTLDHTLVSGALDRMASRPPGGGTDIAAGIDRALDDFEAIEKDDTPDVYTDATLTTIKNRRSGEHRVNRGDW